MNPGHLNPVQAEIKRRALDQGVSCADVALNFSATSRDRRLAQLSIGMGAGSYTTLDELLRFARSPVCSRNQNP